MTRSKDNTQALVTTALRTGALPLGLLLVACAVAEDPRPEPETSTTTVDDESDDPGTTGTTDGGWGSDSETTGVDTDAEPVDPPEPCIADAVRELPRRQLRDLPQPRRIGREGV